MSVLSSDFKIKQRKTYIIPAFEVQLLGIKSQQKELDEVALRQIYNELRRVTSAIADILGMIEPLRSVGHNYSSKREIEFLQFAETHPLFMVKEVALHFKLSEGTVSVILNNLWRAKKLNRVRIVGTTSYQYSLNKPQQTMPQIETETAESKNLEPTAEQKAKETERIRDSMK